MRIIDRRGSPRKAAVMLRAQVGFIRDVVEVEAVAQVLLAFAAIAPTGGHYHCRGRGAGAPEPRAGPRLGRAWSWTDGWSADLRQNRNGVRRVAVPLLGGAGECLGAITHRGARPRRRRICAAAARVTSLLSSSPSPSPSPSPGDQCASSTSTSTPCAPTISAAMATTARPVRRWTPSRRTCGYPNAATPPTRPACPAAPRSPPGASASVHRGDQSRRRRRRSCARGPQSPLHRAAQRRQLGHGPAPRRDSAPPRSRPSASATQSLHLVRRLQRDHQCPGPRRQRAGARGSARGPRLAGPQRRARGAGSCICTCGVPTPRTGYNRPEFGEPFAQGALPRLADGGGARAALGRLRTALGARGVEASASIPKAPQPLAAPAAGGPEPARGAAHVRRLRHRHPLRRSPHRPVGGRAPAAWDLRRHRDPHQLRSRRDPGRAQRLRRPPERRPDHPPCADDRARWPGKTDRMQRARAERVPLPKFRCRRHRPAGSPAPRCPGPGMASASPPRDARRRRPRSATI